MYYPAWKVRVNGAPGDAEADADSGQMIIPLHPGLSRVEVNFGWTADRAAGLALSLAAIIVLAVLAALTATRADRRAALRTQAVALSRSR